MSVPFAPARIARGVSFHIATSHTHWEVGEVYPVSTPPPPSRSREVHIARLILLLRVVQRTRISPAQAEIDDTHNYMEHLLDVRIRMYRQAICNSPTDKVYGIFDRTTRNAISGL